MIIRSLKGLIFLGVFISLQFNLIAQTVEHDTEYIWKKIVAVENLPETPNGNPLGASTYGFNKENREIYFFNSFNSENESLLFFNVDNETFDSVEVTGFPNDNTFGEIIFNSSNKTIQFWRAGLDNAYEVSVNGGEVSQIANGNFDSRRYGAYQFYNGVTQKPAQIFGYGGNRVINSAHELNDSGNWSQKKADSSEEPYRRLMAFRGLSRSSALPNGDYTKTYIIDGQGSPSGSQGTNSCSIEGGKGWATDVGVWCWYRDLWEIDLTDWSFKQILPVNSSFKVTGNFGYDFEKNTFYSFGGFTPSDDFGSDWGDNYVYEDSLRIFNPDKHSEWITVHQKGDVPPKETLFVSYYDEVKDRFILISADGFWELQILEPTDIKVSTGDVEVYGEGSFSAPIYAKYLQEADSISSYEFKFKIPSKIKYVGVDTTETLSNGGTILENNQGDSVKIGFASSEHLYGDSLLLKLNFTLEEFEEQVIKIEEFYLNNIEYQVDSTNITLKPVTKGDIDENGKIQAYDASLALQYSVNKDPMPSIDPLPWEDWRIYAADVDYNDEINANDGVLILQKAVGIIDTFETNQNKLRQNSISISTEDNMLTFNVDETELLGFDLEFNFDSEKITFQQPEINWADHIYAENIDQEKYRIGIASINKAEGAFLKIPYINEINEDEEVVINYNLNGVSYKDTVLINSLSTSIEKETLPQDYSLLQNYPNPFNPTTQIRYGVPKAAEVELTVFNMLGQEVSTLVNGKLSAGWHTTTFDGSGLSSGFYIYRIKAGEFVSTKKLMVIK
ncbi:MAG: T9SS type A sorting domain-containing protein [Candidatus Paceibacterota bacterium]